MIEVGPETFSKIYPWIESRSGIAVWKSINLSNPGVEFFTPAKSLSGEDTIKPNWQCDNEPSEIITSLNDITIIIPKEVKRFRIYTRMSGNGLMIKLTDSSSAKVRKYESQYENSWHQFDYETQECIILVPDKKIPAIEYLQSI